MPLGNNLTQTGIQYSETDNNKYEHDSKSS